MSPPTETLTAYAFVPHFDAQILAGQVAPSSLAIYRRDSGYLPFSRVNLR